MNNKIAGISILILVAGAAISYKTFFSSPPVKTLKGFAGGEKAGFLADEKVKKILKNKYGIHIDYSKAGSIEMVKEKHGKEIDFLWPSSQVSLELFKMSHPDKKVKSEIIFNSPIVLYSWQIVTDKLITAGMVKQTEGTYYITNFNGLISSVIKGKKWSDIGLNELFGRITVISTDPTKSNSGNMFAGLLAHTLAGDTPDTRTISSVLPEIINFFSRLGYMEHSSGDLFDQYLRTGMGAKTIIVGYESQIIEFSIENKKIWPDVKNRVRILYPLPTVWSSHPFIALSPAGNELLTALLDKDIQQIAWERHGFRSGMIGVENDLKVIDMTGVPATIQQVAPMPSAAVMDIIINSLAAGIQK